MHVRSSFPHRWLHMKERQQLEEPWRAVERAKGQLHHKLGFVKALN